MARKFSEGRVTFNDMLAQLKRQKEEPLDTSSDPNLHYKQLLVYHETGAERYVNRLFQKLSKLRKDAGNGAVVQDPHYIPSGERSATAFILRGTKPNELEGAVNQAIFGLPLEYELREW